MSQQFDVKSQHMNASGTAVPFRTRLKGAVISPDTGAAGQVVFYDTSFVGATYTRSTTTVTVTTVNPHNLFSNQWVYLDFTSGGALDGVYQVTVLTSTTFTVTTVASGTITTSNVNLYGNVLCIVDISSQTAVNVVVPDQGILAQSGMAVVLPADTSATIFYG
jgi:hypothetical protein